MGDQNNHTFRLFLFFVSFLIGYYSPAYRPPSSQIPLHLQIDLTFRNPEQETFYWSRFRNNRFGGGFGNGKSYVGCERAFTHLMTFSHYGMSICRHKYKVLKATTMKTFFKICPEDLIYRHNEQDGYTVLINKSFIYWMHLDDLEEEDARGLEINSGLIDQAEEIGESIYNVLDARIGRWDKAIVPEWLLISQLSGENFEIYQKMLRDIKNQPVISKFIKDKTTWPRHPQYGHFLVPNYMDILCNPGDEDEFHWSWRYYVDESPEKRPDHWSIERQTDDSMNDPRTIQQMMVRDQEWIDKYYYGKTGSPKAQIHKVNELSIINPEGSDDKFNKQHVSYTRQQFLDFLEDFKNRAALMRILDHGDTGITACGWMGAYRKVHIYYREYYIGHALISENRQNIFDLSEDEEYVLDIADPSIFKENRQKLGGVKNKFTTVAEEYNDTEFTAAPSICWTPGDNNEFATRNRINELLRPSDRFLHPITKETPAPGIYFIKKVRAVYDYGCDEIIIQTRNQRRTLLGDINGKKIYSEERDENMVDHAYDLVRYGEAEHSPDKGEIKRRPPKRSFAFFNELIKRRNASYDHASN